MTELNNWQQRNEKFINEQQLLEDIARVKQRNRWLIEPIGVSQPDGAAAMVSVEAYKSREEFMMRLAHTRTFLQNLMTQFSDILERTASTHESETKAIKAIENPSSELWIPVNNKRRPNMLAKIVSYIPITPTRGLHATVIPSLEFACQNGELYYAKDCNHFAIRLAGQLFHGNVGKIYTDRRTPEKIKDCKYAVGCSKQENCDYYHDPMLFKGSKDCRNFTASSWTYVHPTARGKTTNGRKYGSIDYLDTDIADMSAEDVSKFNDQIMHDILCSLILAYDR